MDQPGSREVPRTRSKLSSALLPPPTDVSESIAPKITPAPAPQNLDRSIQDTNDDALRHQAIPVMSVVFPLPGALVRTRLRPAATMNPISRRTTLLDATPVRRRGLDA
jgi:hypothetical protein